MVSFADEMTLDAEELRRGKAREIVRDKLTSIPGMIQLLDEN